MSQDGEETLPTTIGIEMCLELVGASQGGEASEREKTKWYGPVLRACL